MVEFTHGEEGRQEQILWRGIYVLLQISKQTKNTKRMRDLQLIWKNVIIFFFKFLGSS